MSINLDVFGTNDLCSSPCVVSLLVTMVVGGCLWPSSSRAIWRGIVVLQL